MKEVPRPTPAELLAFEAGYKCAERGRNLQRALQEFADLFHQTTGELPKHEVL